MSFREHGIMSRQRRIVAWASAAVAAAAAAAAASLAAGLPPASAQPSNAIPVPATVRLHAYAFAVARQSSDATPASAVAVKTTQEKALKAVNPDNTVSRDDGLTVYLVVMKGNFTVHFPVPAGSHEPTGKYLSLMLSARTFKLIDLGLSNHAPRTSLRRLGPVSTLAK